MNDRDKSGLDLIDDRIEKKLRSDDPLDQFTVQAAIEFARLRHSGKQPRRLLSKKELAAVKQKALDALDARRGGPGSLAKSL